jgi:methionine--tRNA ligase beta chain
MNILFIASRKMSSNINVKLIFKESINKLNSIISKLDTQLGVNSIQTANEPITLLNSNTSIPVSNQSENKANSEPEKKKNNKQINNNNNNTTTIKEEVKKAAKAPAENKGNNNNKQSKEDEEKEAKIKLYAECDLRVGHVVDLKYMENSEDIYRLKIDLGEGQPREIGTGLRKYVKEDEILNKKVIVFANLKPKKLGGI